MIHRVLILVVLLFLAIVTGFIYWFFTVNNMRIVVTEKVVRMYRNGSKCIIETDGFSASVKTACPNHSKESLRLIGNRSRRLIDFFKLKKELENADYMVFVKKDQSVIGSLQLPFLIERFRNFCMSLYDRFLPGRVSGLVAGIVLGNKDNISYDFYKEMITSGTVHIAVASGFNLMLLYGFFSSWLYWLFDRKTAFIFLTLILLFYALLAGMEPPIVRAWLMVVMLMFLGVVGRKASGWWLLLTSIWIMLVWDWRLVGNISFQLSVASSFALIVALPYIKQKSEDAGLLAEFSFLEKGEVVTTILATIFTLPIILWHFGRVSLWGVVSNIFILPLVPLLMVFGLLMLILPQVFYFPVYLLGTLVVELIHFFGN